MDSMFRGTHGRSLCPHCKSYLALEVVERGWGGSKRPEGRPTVALTRLRLRGMWIDNAYRMRLPTGHVSVAEPFGLHLREAAARCELDALAEFGYSYVISPEQAMHWAGRTVSVQLYPKGVRPIDLKEFWLETLKAKGVIKRHSSA